MALLLVGKDAREEEDCKPKKNGGRHPRFCSDFATFFVRTSVTFSFDVGLVFVVAFEEL